MKRIVFIIIVVLNWNVGISQNEIEIPKFEYVQVDYDLRDYLAIFVNKNGEIKIGNEKITLVELKQSLFKELSHKAKYEGLRLPISIIELISDKDLEFEKLEPLLIEFRKLSFLKIHFACNSEKEKRTEGLKITGFLYKLNSIPDSKSIIFEVSDSLNSEMERIIKARGKDIEKFRKSQIPPPPPPPEITAAQLKNGEINIEVKEIEITNESFIIEEEKYSLKELSNKMKEWNSNEPIAYILKPTPECKYEKILTPIAVIKQVLKSLWDKESIKTFNEKYELLDYWERNKIRNRYPFIMVIDE